MELKVEKNANVVDLRNGRLGKVLRMRSQGSECFVKWDLIDKAKDHPNNRFRKSWQTTECLQAVKLSKKAMANAPAIPDAPPFRLTK